jgi:hypothetical protein
VRRPPNLQGLPPGSNGRGEGTEVVRGGRGVSPLLAWGGFLSPLSDCNIPRHCRTTVYPMSCLPSCPRREEVVER